MEELIDRLSRINLEQNEIEQKKVSLPSKCILVKTIGHLYKENIDLKQELSRLRNLLQVVNEPRIPEWVK